MCGCTEDKLIKIFITSLVDASNSRPRRCRRCRRHRCRKINTKINGQLRVGAASCPGCNMLEVSATTTIIIIMIIIIFCMVQVQVHVHKRLERSSCDTLFLLVLFLMGILLLISSQDGTGKHTTLASEDNQSCERQEGSKSGGY